MLPGRVQRQKFGDGRKKNEKGGGVAGVGEAGGGGDVAKKSSCIGWV